MDNLWLIYGKSVDSLWVICESGWWLNPTPLKNMTLSTGMIIPFPTEWENASHVPNHQPVLGLNRFFLKGGCGKAKKWLTHVETLWRSWWWITSNVVKAVKLLAWNLKPYKYWWSMVIDGDEWWFSWVTQTKQTKQLHTNVTMRSEAMFLPHTSC